MMLRLGSPKDAEPDFYLCRFKLLERLERVNDEGKLLCVVAFADVSDR